MHSVFLPRAFARLDIHYGWAVVGVIFLTMLSTSVKRSTALKVCFFGAVRRRTFICCRNTQISTSSAVRKRNRSAPIQTMSPTRSFIR